MINVYTDRDYLGESHRRFVFPLLFHLWYKEDEPLRQVYTLLTDDAAADVYVLPLSVEYYISNGLRAVMHRFIDQALERQKPVWVYSSGDLGLTFTKPVWVFRFGGFDSKLGERTIILPAHTTDPYRTLDKEFQPIDKETSPFIAFTGNADGSFGKWIKELYIQWYYFWHRFRRSIPSDPQPFFPSGIVRYRLLKKLQEDARIRTDFIFRKSYRAGAKTEDDRVRTHLEFLRNMEKAPYTFCLRGNGNFSVRFYEALAMGRIPVLVDTDCRLPLPTLIDWDKHCVKVSGRSIADDLWAFHQTITPADFRAMQEENRALWYNKLRDVRFFHTVHDFFVNIINSQDEGME